LPIFATGSSARSPNPTGPYDLKSRFRSCTVCRYYWLWTQNCYPEPLLIKMAFFQTSPPQLNGRLPTTVKFSSEVELAIAHMGFPSKSSCSCTQSSLSSVGRLCDPNLVAVYQASWFPTAAWECRGCDRGQLPPTRCQNPPTTKHQSTPSVNGAVVRFPLIVNISDDSDSNRLLVISLTGHAISLLVFLSIEKHSLLYTIPAN